MKIIDLSVPLYTGMPVFPGDPEVEIEVVQTLKTGDWELRHLSLGSHTGTHVDAFSHMHEEKESLDGIPLERFLGQAQVVTIAKDWPSEIGLFFKEEVGVEYFEKIVRSNPGFVGGIITEDLERLLLKHEIITYTGLINLEKIPENKTFTFIGLPLKINAGDGSPVRAIGVIE